ncbi:MAG: phosphoglycerate mutase [Xylophilus ampelinus]
MHLLIPFAAASAPGCRQALADLRLPNLERLLAQLAPVAADAAAPAGEADELSLSPPHERALARALGLPAADGAIPWAALEAARGGAADGADAGAAWAFVTPCHWMIGADHITLADPSMLRLDAAGSRQLLALLAPYCADDGIALRYAAPTRWLARGEAFRGLATASLDRVAGRNIDLWMPDAPQARSLRRLQSEMQMLLYTHPWTEARAEAGLPAVNSLWFSGTGALPPGWTPPPGPEPVVPAGLRDAGLREDWAAWRAAWERIDAGECAALRAAADAGRPAALTLCGERAALAFAAGAEGALGRWRRKISGLFGGQRLQDLQDVL